MDDVEAVIDRALGEPGNAPVIRRVALVSGGGDSSVLGHRCREHYDELLHIDTGTALPGVREHVEAFAAALDTPLRVVEAGDAYRRLVLGEDAWWPIYHEHREEGEGPDAFRRRTLDKDRYPTRAERMALGAHLAPMGFPGPAGHNFAYQKLKERQLEAGLRAIKAEFGNGRMAQRVALFSGVRVAESARRKMTGAAQGEWERKGNQLWINPLLSWSNARMAEYRREHDLKLSDVAALTHKSSECMCLAFAARGEAAFIRSLFPDWTAEVIEPIEREARERGLEHDEWGWGAGKAAVGDVGPLCQGCEQLKLDV